MLIVRKLQINFELIAVEPKIWKFPGEGTGRKLFQSTQFLSLHQFLRFYHINHSLTNDYTNSNANRKKITNRFRVYRVGNKNRKFFR